MPQSVQNAILVWIAPMLFAMLIGVLSYLWLDMRGKVDGLQASVVSMRETLVRLTTLQERGSR